MIPRLRDRYQKSVIPEMMKQFGYRNPHECPQMKKIVINIGLSEAREDIKAVDQAILDLSAMTGQKPRVTRAKKSISNFKLREGMPIGAFVTLRGNRMYEFLDRLVTCALPRLRDFRGLLASSLDGRGSLNIGLTEQYIFPEISPDKSPKVRGMNISIVTTAQDDARARTILSLLGMPFRKEKAVSRQPSAVSN